MNAEPLLAVVGAGWPALAAGALFALRERRRAAVRRRRLNECLHELRRPLQALVLRAPAPPAGAPDSLELALAALRDLDREVNGSPPEPRRRPVEAKLLAIAAAERWRVRAARSGRRIVLRWGCERELANADPVRVAQALDNLLANALEHGRGQITLEGVAQRGRIELRVRDEGGRWRAARRACLRAGGRRGHGLRVARDLVRRDGGALRLRSGAGGTVATIQLPLAPGAAERRRGPSRARRAIPHGA